ncbi:unnamed protein product [Linum tenue]|uniref:Uncharacterized protein n=1 Tax=Linum tenue TaxID=586396 RepID=A0AAV0R7D4_9ROSI|nr:unnamed protein product [Linum tenue]
MALPLRKEEVCRQLQLAQTTRASQEWCSTGYREKMLLIGQVILLQIIISVRPLITEPHVSLRSRGTRGIRVANICIRVNPAKCSVVVIAICRAERVIHFVPAAIFCCFSREWYSRMLLPLLRLRPAACLSIWPGDLLIPPKTSSCNTSTTSFIVQGARSGLIVGWKFEFQ